jgi:GNAT superfamily N-acetyltransferase
MERVVVRKGRRADATEFIGLVLALAKFEHLEPPSDAGRKRLVEDVFEKKRINLFVAAEGKRLLGYALYFFTYSSFLARPTLYLEDLFVLEEHRKRGVGLTLFKQCVDEAVAKECGRMEWSVLTWNDKALRFYEKLGAKRLSEWYTYRLDEMSLSKIRS